MSSLAVSPVTVEGIGLMSGLSVRVEISPAPKGHGIVFYMEGESPIPACLEAVAHTERGVVLANPERKTLAIVEHFLCATQLAGLKDLKVSVYGVPEMPILDGSARDWLELFNQHAAELGAAERPSPTLSLERAVFYRHNDNICLYAIPDTHFKVTYCLDFNHPDLKNQWARWDSQTDDIQRIAASVTFDYLSELPKLQAAGFAKGASLDNALGLTEDGYTRPLRHEAEPIHHKMLDLIGDLSLAGFNPLALKAHVFAVNAGHSSHVPFARLLKKALVTAGT